MSTSHVLMILIMRTVSRQVGKDPGSSLVIEEGWPHFIRLALSAKHPLSAILSKRNVKVVKVKYPHSANPRPSSGKGNCLLDNHITSTLS